MKPRTMHRKKTFDMNIEGRAIPCFYFDGDGSWGSREWPLECNVAEEEWLEKRVWSVDTRFRQNRVCMFAQYDRRQKNALYAVPNYNTDDDFLPFLVRGLNIYILIPFFQSLIQGVVCMPFFSARLNGRLLLITSKAAPLAMKFLV